MVSNSKKYFTALFVRTALKTNTKRFHPTGIPIFRKSISGTCIPHVQIKESKKLNTKLIMEAQLPSYSWQCLTLCVCALSVLCTEGDPMAFQKMGLFGAFSTEQLCCICRANGWLSQVTESEQHCQGWLLCWGIGQNVCTHKQMGLFLDSVTVCLLVCHCRLLCCLSSKYLLLNLAILKTGDRSPTQNQLCPVFMTAFGPCMLIFNV